MTRPQRATTAPHGTNTRYASGCNCLPCRAAHSDYVKERTLARLATGPVCTSAKPVRDHINTLITKGWSNPAIAHASGLNTATINNIRRGISRTVRDTTLQAILAVTTPPECDLKMHVPAAPSARLVKRLSRVMTEAAIARELGMYRQSLPKPGQLRTSAKTATAIRRLADKHGIRTGVLVSVPEYCINRDKLARIIETTGYEYAGIIEAAGGGTVAQIFFGNRLATEDKAERIAIALGVRIESVFERVAS